MFMPMFMSTIRFISDACTSVGKVIGAVVKKTTKVILTKIKKEEIKDDDIEKIEKTANDIGYITMMLTTVTLMWTLLQLRTVSIILTIVALTDTAIMVSKFTQFLKSEKKVY